MAGLERLRNLRTRLLPGLVACLAVALGISYLQAGDGLSRRILDRQFNLLQQQVDHPLQGDVVIVGIDEGSFNKYREPFELWHPYLAGFLQAMKMARPGVVGLDVALPERSYQFLLPGYEAGMLDALKALSEQTPVVLARKLDAEGGLRVVDGALASSVADLPASVMLCPDVDGVFRRFDLNRCTVNAQGMSFAEKIVARLGIAQPGNGLVDFSAGQKFDYVPFTRVLEWQERAEYQRLQAAFSGKVVLLGVVSARANMINVPVPMAAWAPMEQHVPEVLVQAQILRSMITTGLIREIPAWGGACMALVAALFWLGRSGWLKLMILVVAPVLLWLLSTGLLVNGIYLPLGGILLAGLFAFMARLGHDSIQLLHDRRGLRDLFDSYVNHEVLNEIMSGKIDATPEGDRVNICLLYVRIIDFDRRVAREEPRKTIWLMNEYYSEMGGAIHQHQGTLDRFSDGGMLAFFGAPKALESPERSALEAAQEMLQRQHELNRELRESGIAEIEMEIALHMGKVVVGHVGMATRKEYMAIGSEVGVVKALVELAKEAASPVVCSAEVAEAVGKAGGLSEVGERLIVDRMFRVFSWKPPVLEARG